MTKEKHNSEPNQSDEELIIDRDLNDAERIRNLMESQANKIAEEEKTKRTLWALDILIKEKVINSKTTLGELVRIARERVKELRQTSAYAEDILGSKPSNDINAELHKKAEEDIKESDRLLTYFQAAELLLEAIQRKDHESDTPLGQIYKRLKGDLEIMDTAIERSETSKRREGEINDDMA